MVVCVRALAPRQCGRTDEAKELLHSSWLGKRGLNVGYVPLASKVDHLYSDSSSNQQSHMRESASRSD